MSKAATILVLGDPGPFRKELLIHKEIEVIWASSPEDAAQILADTTIDACIVAPEFRDRVDVLKTDLIHVPCIALQPTNREAQRPDFASVVEVEKVDSLVALLSEHTGLQFARYPRADVLAPVTLQHNGRVHHLDSIDLSLSGIAIAAFPPAQVGTRFELILDVGERSLHLTARVVRWFEHQGQRAAGLTFVDVTESQREVIGAAVKKVLQWGGDDRLSADTLFGDLGLENLEPQALRTLDVANKVPAFVLRTQDLEIPRLCQLLDGEEILAPDWLGELAEDLTAVEAAAARGRPCPAWAHRVLRLRLHLAHAKSTTRKDKIPSSLLDEAYRVFESLRDEGVGQSGSMVAQIGRIRAALLRNIVSSRKKPLPVPRRAGSEVKAVDASEIITGPLPAFR